MDTEGTKLEREGEVAREGEGKQRKREGERGEGGKERKEKKDREPGTGRGKCQTTINFSFNKMCNS